MKIAIDCRFWGTKHTGLGRYTQSLVENLLKIDKKNDYILLDNKLIKASPYSLKEQFILPQVLKKTKPDLIHFPHFNVPFFNNFPFVVTIHDLIKHRYKGMSTTTRSPWIYLLKYWGYKTIFKAAVQRSKKIIVPSNFVKKELLKYYSLDKNKIEVIYEGVDKKINTSKSKVKGYLLYVGNVYPHKNLHRLILAVKKINQTHFCPLKIVCSRDVFFQRLRRKIKDFQAEKFIELVSHISDTELRVLYSQARVFINPSLMEGFGLPGLEAMTNNCPVLCSSIPTFKEIYDQAALYFNPRSIDDIAEKIIRLIKFSDKERKELIKKGKNQASKYSWQKCAQQTLEVYKSL